MSSKLSERKTSMNETKGQFKVSINGDQIYKDENSKISLDNTKTLLTSNRQQLVNKDIDQGSVQQDKFNVTAETFRDTDLYLADLRQDSQNDKNKTGLSGKKDIEKKGTPAYLMTLNESEKQANFKIIQNMAKRIAFLKNPRFRQNKAPITMTDAIKNKAALDFQSMKISSFRVEPPIINFANYQVNGVYQIPIKVTNITTILRRIKFIPPQSSNFTIKNVQYPSQTKGDIAPGMSLTLDIVFSAPSFADYEDVITFVTEETQFKIPMRARRDPPAITLVNPMDCLNSWLGDRVDMAFRCMNTGGDGGFKFFCERDEDDSKQTDPDTIRIGSFTLTPSEFYLYNGSAIDIYVSFNPEKEGQLEENLILACDNQTSEFYKLKGYGAMIDLEIIAVDGKSVNFKENPFETIYFENTNPTSESRRTITVRNSSPIVIPFHWSIYKQKNALQISLEKEVTHYRVTPAQGKILGGQTQDFEIFFCPQHAESYQEFADFIIEDVPIASVRDPPPGLKQFAQNNTVKNPKVPMPTYVGSNTQFLSIPIIQFNLKGQGNSCKVEIEPSYCIFDGDTFINKEYVKEIKLKKRSEGQVNYTMRLEGKSRSSFQIDVQTQGKTLMSSPDGIIKSIIPSNQDEITLRIVVKQSERGEDTAYFFVQIEDGSPISFQVLASFVGPIIRCSNPIVDFGLIKVNTQEFQEIEIVNTSPIEAQLLIKNSLNSKLSFLSMLSIEEIQKNESVSRNSSLASLIFDKPLQTSKGNAIQLDNYLLKLKPFEKQILSICLITNLPESIEEHFEIMVKDGNSNFFQIQSEVQGPQVSLNRVIMNLGRIYAGVPEYINPQSKHKNSCLVLQNFGNLPAHFKWENINDPERCQVQFEPLSGVIQPRSELKVKMTVTVYTGGNLNELFLCDIQDMELPLGFEMLADAYGLNVSYETQDDNTSGLFNNSTFSSKSKSGVFNQIKAGNSSKPLQIFNFPHCSINKASSQKFILRNLSGIKTSFMLDCVNFAPLSQVAPKEVSELEKAKEQAEQEAKRQLEEAQNPQQNSSPDKKKKKVGFASGQNSSNQMGKSGFDSTSMRNRPILSDEHEQTQKFSSAVGETFTKTKQIEKQQGFYLSNNKGLAIVFTPHMGDLPPNSEVPITVTIYNNVCGKFDDRIISKVKGLPDIEFPISISITGSPVLIPLNQVGLNYNTIPATLPIPTVVCRSKPVSKTFTVKNTGIKSIQIDWQIFDQKSPSLMGQTGSSQNAFVDDLFQVEIVKNFAFDKQENPFKFEYQAIVPEPSRDSAFKIEPESYVVGSRSFKEFTVTFDPTKGQSGQFHSIILASPELSQEEIEIQGGTSNNGQNIDLMKKGALGIISLNLEAFTIDPVLSIDKKLKMDNQNHLRMKYWSVPNEEGAPDKVQKIIFTNESKADLTFNLNINGPFDIVKTKTNSGATHPLASQNTITQVGKLSGSSKTASSKIVAPKVETMFCLQPLKIVEIHVKFKAPQPNDSQAWPMTIFNECNGELIAYFANGDQQKLFLDGVLLRPKLKIVTDFPSKNDYAMDELDFGKVNTQKNRTLQIYLANETDVTAKWSLNYVKFPKKATIGHSTTTPWEIENMKKTDDPEVFEFSVTSGQLKGKSLPVKKVPEGLLVPPVAKSEEQKKYLPLKILIKFQPKANVLYKSKFRFVTENGLACDIILKGTGSYEENHD